MYNFWKLSSLACLAGGIASAGVIDLNFENIAPYPNSNTVQILNYYDGGTSSIGTSGPNYGISFPSNALVICLNTIGTQCSNTSQGPYDSSSNEGAMYFLSGNTTYLDDPAGFTTGFAFDYTASNGSAGSIEVWSGLDGTGTQLASLSLGQTPSTCSDSYSAGFCPFVDESLAFSGTAMSIEFDGVPDQIVFDDITFGSTTVGGGGGVPEPNLVIPLAVGLIGLSFLKFRRRKAAVR